MYLIFATFHYCLKFNAQREGRCKIRQKDTHVNLYFSIKRKRIILQFQWLWFKWCENELPLLKWSETYNCIIRSALFFIIATAFIKMKYIYLYHIYIVLPSMSTRLYAKGTQPQEVLSLQHRHTRKCCSSNLTRTLLGTNELIQQSEQRSREAM